MSATISEKIVPKYPFSKQFVGTHQMKETDQLKNLIVHRNYRSDVNCRLFLFVLYLKRMKRQLNFSWIVESLVMIMSAQDRYTNFAVKWLIILHNWSFHPTEIRVQHSRKLNVGMSLQEKTNRISNAYHMPVAFFIH